MFLAFLHAKPYQLGFDPTVALLPNDPTNSEINYEIIVQTETGVRVVYHTLELLSAIGLQKLWTKGTRVWKVVRVVNGESHADVAILKDSWVDEGRERETATFNRFSSIAHPEEYRHTVKKSFLTLECFGDVYINSDLGSNRLDSTRLNCVAQRTAETEQASKNTTHRPLAQIHHKVHHRMVVKEICEPLHTETSLLRIFTVLDEVSLSKPHKLFRQASIHDFLQLCR